MAGTKHTPGPWNVNTLPKWHTEVFAGLYLICEAIGGQRHLDEPRNPKQDEANARLIAAAPDLLAALKMVKSRDDAYDLDISEHERDQLHDAISKAEMT